MINWQTADQGRRTAALSFCPDETCDGKIADLVNRRVNHNFCSFFRKYQSDHILTKKWYYANNSREYLYQKILTTWFNLGGSFFSFKLSISEIKWVTNVLQFFLKSCFILICTCFNEFMSVYYLKAMFCNVVN